MAYCYFDKAFYDNSEVKNFFEKSKLHQNYPLFMKKHYGRYHVVFLDFSKMNDVPDAVTSSDEFMRFYKSELSRLMQNIYTNFAERAGQDNQLFKESRCYNDLLNNGANLNTVIDSIKNLYKFFGHSNVIVLVDGYDCVYQKAIELNCDSKIVDLMGEMFGYVRLGLCPVTHITGVIPLIDDSSAHRIYTQLRNDTMKFVDELTTFYGFTSDELKKDLFTEISDKEIMLLNKEFGGYKILNTVDLYCPRSAIIHFEKIKPQKRIGFEQIPSHWQLSKHEISFLHREDDTINELLQAKQGLKYTYFSWKNSSSVHGIEFLFYHGFVSAEKYEIGEYKFRITNQEARCYLQRFQNQFYLNRLRNSIPEALTELAKKRSKAAMSGFKKCILDDAFIFEPEKESAILIRLTSEYINKMNIDYKIENRYFVMMDRIFTSSRDFKTYRKSYFPAVKSNDEYDQYDEDNEHIQIILQAKNPVLREMILDLLKSELKDLIQQHSHPMPNVEVHSRDLIFSKTNLPQINTDETKSDPSRNKHTP